MLNKRLDRRPSSRQVANANAGWLGTPDPQPCFANVQPITKASSKESLLSHGSRQSRQSADTDCKIALSRQSSQSRQSAGHSSNKEADNAGISSGSPTPRPSWQRQHQKPQERSLLAGISSAYYSPRPSWQKQHQKPQEDLPDAVDEKKKVRRPSKLLSQVKKMVAG